MQAKLSRINRRKEVPPEEWERRERYGAKDDEDRTNNPAMSQRPRSNCESYDPAFPARSRNHLAPYEVNENRIINRSVDVDRIEKDTGQSIHHYQVVPANSPTAQHQARMRDSQMAIYKPDVMQTPEGHAPRPPSAEIRRHLA